MKHLLSIASYLFVIAMTVIFVKAIKEPLHVVSIMPQCHMVIISEFGDPRLYQTRVCSDEDLARVYGEQLLRERAWMGDHDCDQDDADTPDVKRMKR